MNAFFKTLGLACASAVLSLQMTGQVTITQPYTTAEEYVQEILLGEGVTATNITYTGSLAQLGLLENGSGVFSVESGSCQHGRRHVRWILRRLLGWLSAGSRFAGRGQLGASAHRSIFHREQCERRVHFGIRLRGWRGQHRSTMCLGRTNTSLRQHHVQRHLRLFLERPWHHWSLCFASGFPDGAINIAQVPESDPLLPVTISSVNNVTNSDYYIDNDGGGFGGGPFDICVNGFTTTFTAAAAVSAVKRTTSNWPLPMAPTLHWNLLWCSNQVLQPNAVNLEADAVPFSAGGLQNLALRIGGVAFSLQLPQRRVFSFGEWSANNETIVTVDGQETVIDAVIIEGCNDARFTVIRPEVEADLLDTLYLGLAGSAILGLDYSDTFDEGP